MSDEDSNTSNDFAELLAQGLRRDHRIANVGRMDGGPDRRGRSEPEGDAIDEAVHIPKQTYKTLVKMSGAVAGLTTLATSLAVLTPYWPQSRAAAAEALAAQAAINDEFRGQLKDHSEQLQMLQDGYGELRSGQLETLELQLQDRLDQIDERIKKDPRDTFMRVQRNEVQQRLRMVQAKLGRAVP